MKFGIFDYIDDRGEPLQKTFEDRLTLLQAAEAAGFYGYHLTEHHATPLSMTPSPSVFLAAAARETKRIRLGTLLYLLPLYHPLRLIEELCMLDHLSGGRLDIGVGRGISPMEFAAYGVDFNQSGEDFEHVFNILCQGFTRDRVDYHGGRFGFTDVPVVMKPRQHPHPPFWYGLRGDHGPAFAARHGMHGVTLGPDEKVARILAAFRKEWATAEDERRRHGSSVASPVENPFCGVMRAMFIADTDAQAERIARDAYKRWFDALAWLWVERGSFPPISISADYDAAKAQGTLVVGGPETVARILLAQAQRIRHNYLVLLIAFGSLTHAQEMRSLALFKDEIMPKLAALNEDALQSAPALAGVS
jgi:alkanesulfonate monooxygenase SsuD/methylene tetrahydromethanopterin reductase-like flavin-dependent oxidoreductase (luciferase family)